MAFAREGVQGGEGGWTGLDTLTLRYSVDECEKCILLQVKFEENFFGCRVVVST